MLSGATAAAAIANGSALPLGDSGLAFGFVELLWREPNTLDGQESLEQSPSPLMGEGWGGGDVSARPGTTSTNNIEAAPSPPPKSSPIKGEDLPIGSIILPTAGFPAWQENSCPPETQSHLATLRGRLIQPLSLWAGFSLSRPLVMGIVNVTPDSFSDGGDHLDPNSAIRHGLSLLEAGADILDIGGESTRPGAVPVAPEIEIARVVPVIRALASRGAVISIDSRHPDVMARALDAGARIINDINALQDPGALTLAVQRKVPVVLMHMQGDPQSMQKAPRYTSPPLDIWDFLEARLNAFEMAGGSRAIALVDPGIGFGKTGAQNLEILRHLGLFRSLGTGILLGVSRKRLIEQFGGTPAGPKQRLGGSIALGLDGIAQGAQVLRVHDVAETVQSVRLWQALHQGE